LGIKFQPPFLITWLSTHTLIPLLRNIRKTGYIEKERKRVCRGSLKEKEKRTEIHFAETSKNIFLSLSFVIIVVIEN
jgi:hypothetical protein